MDSSTLQILSICAILPLYLSLGSKGLANTFAVVNKIKVPTLVTLAFAVASTVTVFTFLKFTDMGIYAIAIVSSSYLVLKESVFVPIYASKCLDVKVWGLMKNVLKCILVVVVCSCISYLCSRFANITGWMSLIVWGIISSIAVCAFILLTLFKKRDYINLFNKGSEDLTEFKPHSSKKNKEKTPTLDVKSIDIDKEPLYNTKRHSNGDLYFKAPQVRNNAKIYSGNLKI